MITKQKRKVGDTSYTWHLTVWKSGGIFSRLVTPIVAPKVTPTDYGRPWNIYERPWEFYGRPWNFYERLVRFWVWRETLAERVGATPGATIGVGTGATTHRCNCLIISIRCAGCHQLSPFRLERAYTYVKDERYQGTTGIRTAYTTLVVSHLTG